MAETVVTEVVVPVAKWTLKRIWQELGYVFSYKSNVGDLNKQVQELSDKRDGVDLEVKPAREALKSINPGVDRWLGDVDKIIKEKETSFSEETVAAKAACCNGWLPNLKCRYSLGKKAKNMTEKVDELFAKDLGTIAHRAPHPEVEFQPTEESIQLGKNFHEGASSSGTSDHEQPPGLLNFDSRRSTIGDVMEALRGNQINPIIICGMGGIGKTTLMGQVLEKAKEEGQFDEYTKATLKEYLNKAADLCIIQDELARYLGLPLDGKETDARASMLRQRLSQGSKKILVILDNVWTTGPDFLWDIGIPPSCQLLVTSRQRDLFKNMDTRKNFPIHGLPDRDSWSLFKKTAGSSIESDPEVHVVAKKVLKECAGLPIAISTVGTALKGESIAIWKNALRELGKASPENVPGVIEHVYGKIKLSYECLPNEQAKSFLLLSCIFEESADIPIEDLIRYGHGLGLLKGIDSMVEGRNCLETLVHTLKSRFLLLDSDHKECVRMHDVVRDVAVHIASEELELVEKKNYGVEKRIVVRDKAKTVQSLMDWPMDSDSQQWKSTYCSSLGISGPSQLLLFGKIPTSTISLVLPPTIFNRMEDLRVVAIINGDKWHWSHMSLDSLLPSLANLRNLQTLRLETCNFCYFPWGVSVIGELRSLMILSLRGCYIKQLPDTFKNLSDLRLLDLTDCEFTVISPGVISCLTRLEELYMWGSFEDWVVEKLASTETTDWISQLEAEQESAAQVGKQKKIMKVETWKWFNRLAVEQPAEVVMEEFRNRVQFGYLKNTDCTRWANSMDWETGILAELLSLSRLTTLQVVLPPVNVLLSSPLFNKLERFKIFIGWKQHLPRWEFKHFGVDGNYLRVRNLDASATVDSGITLLLKKTSFLEFSASQTQLLSVLDALCFAKIKRLKLMYSKHVEYLIDTTLVKPTTPNGSSAIFPVLNSLKIRSAKRLKEIFQGELPTGSLKELRSLTLNNLPALTYIWKTKSQSDQWGVLGNILGLIQVLKITCCNSLEAIVAFEYDNEEVISFSSLTELTLNYLPNFTGISKNISKRLERLPEDSSSEVYYDVIIKPLFDSKAHFPVLLKLYIDCVNLKQIWNSQLSAESFCELRILQVEGCHKLLHLVPTHMQNRLQKLEYIQAYRCSSLIEIFEFRRLIVNDEGDATSLTISKSGNQGMQINKMMSFTQSRQAFQNLIKISIYDCKSLRTLLSPSIARGLVNLQELMIEECEKIEEIVAPAAEGEESEDDNMFPQLQSLRLEDLPNLGSFSEGKYNFKWSLAEDIKILECKNMKKFCSGSLSTPKEVEIKVEGAGGSVLQELNNSRQEI